MSEEVQKRSGTRYIPFMDDDTDMIIVSMIEFKENIYVATQKGIYIVVEGKLKRLELVEKEE